jgi:hypothetical protein
MPKDLEGEGGPDFKLRLLILFLVLVVETGGVLGYQYHLTQQVTERQTERERLTAEMERVEGLAEEREASLVEALSFTRQLTAVEAILDQHVYPSKLVKRVRELELPYVDFDRVLVDLKSTVISVDAVASPPTWPHRRMAQQIVKFNEATDVQEARHANITTSVAKDGGFGGVNTTFLLKFNPDVWSYSGLDDEAAAAPDAAANE